MPIEARRNLTQIRLMDDVTMSGITQGDVIYHGASKWNNLAAGTAGNLLATGGSGANPSWASRLVYSSSGTLLAVNAGATTDVPFAVNGAASHTGDLAQFKVNGVSKGYISSAGVLQLGGTLVNDGLTISGAWPCTITARVSNGSYSVGDGTIRSGSGHALTLRGSLSSGAAVLIENIGSSGFGDTCRITAGAATSQVLQLRGTTSQTATLIQLQGTSTSTGGAAGTAQAEVDTAWVDSTHASRKARLLLRAYDTAVREGLRIDADGSYALTAIGGGTVTAGASLTVKSPTTTYVPLVVDSPASQSADLQQWKVNGTTVASLSPTPYLTLVFGGRINISSSGSIHSPSGNVIAIEAISAGGGYSALYVGNSQGGPTSGNTIRVDGALHSSYLTDLTITSGGTYSNSQTAGNLHLRGGTNYAGGTNSNGGKIYIYPGVGSGTGITGDIALGYSGSTAIGNLSLFGAGSFGSGVNVIFIANATTVPSTDPTGGGILYCEGGALKYRGSSGTITTLGAA